MCKCILEFKLLPVKGHSGGAARLEVPIFCLILK